MNLSSFFRHDERSDFLVSLVPCSGYFIICESVAESFFPTRQSYAPRVIFEISVCVHEFDTSKHNDSTKKSPLLCEEKGLCLPCVSLCCFFLMPELAHLHTNVSCFFVCVLCYRKCITCTRCSSHESCRFSTSCKFFFYSRPISTRS